MGELESCLHPIPLIVRCPLSTVHCPLSTGQPVPVTLYLRLWAIAMRRITLSGLGGGGSDGKGREGNGGRHDEAEKKADISFMLDDDVILYSSKAVKHQIRS